MSKKLLVVGISSFFCVILVFFNTLFDHKEVEAQTGMSDWIQHQFDAARTGRTIDSPSSAQYRLRWLWMGPNTTVRNHKANTSWSGPDILPGDIVDQKTTLPKSVPFTINWGVQPIYVQGVLYLGDMDGSLYAINAMDGSTKWSAQNPGGTLSTVLFASNTVIVNSLSGWMRGYEPSTGTMKWQYNTGGLITSAPVTDGSIVCSGNHIGVITCLSPSTGTLLWKTASVGAPIASGLAMDTTTLYAGAENMNVYAFTLANGSLRASTKVSGQTFYGTWPVVYNGLLYVEAGAIPMIGSEYVMDEVMAVATSSDDEQSKIIDWMRGLGGYVNASSDWKHLTVLRTVDLSEPFIVPAGPIEGLGKTPYPPVVDNQNRVLTYFKTKYPTLTKVGVFGSSYSVDISGIDQVSGKRIPINNNKLGGIWWWDTDNLFIPSIAGDYLVLNHSYHRGIYTLNLKTSTGHWIKTYHRRRAQEFSTQADVTYFDDMVTSSYIETSQNPWSERTPAIVVGTRFYAAEDFGLVALEPNN